MDPSLYLESIDHWRARFLSVGVPEAVFEDIRSRLRDWNEWPILWEAEGAAELEHAERHSSLGATVTATDCFARASLYFHFAQFVLFDDEELRWRLAAWKEIAFERALPGLRPPGEKIAVPSPLGDLHGILRIPGVAIGDRPPVVIVLPGADSTKEEYFALEDVLLARGLATITVDGPGQGETRRRGVGFRFDYEEAFPAVVGAIQARPEVNGEAIGLLGLSFGGYLGPRVAARCPEIRATATLGGCFDLSYWEDLPALLKEDLRYLFGAVTVAKAGRLAAQHVSLQDIAPEIAGDLLIVHGTDDRIFRWEDAERTAALKPGAEVKVYQGGDHCCHNRSHRAKPYIGDWLAARLLV